MERRSREVLQWLEEQPDTVVLTALDPEYPPQLMAMETQRPSVLYVRGERSMLPVLNSLSIAVIGSRWPGEYVIRHAPAFVDELAGEAGMPIVSGLARGCDRMGHEAAIRAGFPTIAVMPCGPDRIVPEVNRDLAARILDGHGLLITEYPPGTQPEDYQYVERDRITAALSSAAVVIQGARDSGTMQTVKASRSYRRPVACWLPEGLIAEEADEFEGNRYMADTYGACLLRDEASVRRFADRLRSQGFPASEHTEQLSFI